MQDDPVVIVGLARTPMGAFQGELKGFAAPQLGAAVGFDHLAHSVSANSSRPISQRRISEVPAPIS